MMNSGASFVWLIVIVIFYFVPSMLAAMRGVNSPKGIQLLNLLLGWTVVGWLIALIWAASAETREQAKTRIFDYDKLAATMRSQDLADLAEVTAARKHFHHTDKPGERP